MKKVIMVCLCTALFVGTPLMSLAVQPKSFVPETRRILTTPTLNGDDDGPYAGGLDDPTDWIYLASFVGNLLIIPVYILNVLTVTQEQGVISIGFVWNFLILYWAVRYGAFYGFFEAFDLRDMDEDGN
jgi:hypothetical protein